MEEHTGKSVMTHARQKYQYYDFAFAFAFW